MTARSQSPGEEIANSLSHGVALLAVIAAVPLLIAACGQGSAARLAGGIVFGVTLLLLYGASTLYHALPAGRAKRVFLKLDHCAISLFIAGSYTPFALEALDGVWSWALLALVWLMAAAGIALQLAGRLSHPRLSASLYLAMGWVVLGAAVPLARGMPEPALLWLVAGGAAYTGGVVFFLLDSRVRYSHAVWHGFVVAGTGCHFTAVLHSAAGAAAGIV